jgi:arabinan endo-1,5-alpha-L-arabinosidase
VKAMRTRLAALCSRIALAGAGAAALLAAAPAQAQLAGQPFIHDPSTVTYSDGKWWTFGSGRGGLSSPDGWTWMGGAVRPGGGVAPDVIKIGDRYLVAYAFGGGGMNGGHASNVKIMWTYSLDPKSPRFGFHDVGVVASTDGVEDADAIDPAFLLANGRLWLSYGTYFGFIRIVELDPKTGLRVAGNQPVDVAIDMEASALMYRDGWYYLLGTHGTCCDGPNSSYNIRVGRSRSVLGPYLDRSGVPLLHGGGTLVMGARGRDLGAGHFGLIDLGADLQKFSFHWEADLDRSGRSVLAIQPLLWRDGWPVGGENVAAGTYEIRSMRSGGALELAVDFVRMPFDPRHSFRAAPDEPTQPLPDQTLAEDSAVWPAGPIGVDLNDFMLRPHQEWRVEPVPEAGGFMGAPYYRITIAGTTRALAARSDGQVEAVPAFTGAPDQLWRIDQLTDGSYRVTPRAHQDLALVAIGASTPALVPFDPAGEGGRWSFERQP